MCVSMASGLAGLHWKLWHTAKLTRSNVFFVKNYSRIKVYVTRGDPSWLSNHPNTGLHFKLSVNSTQNGCIYTYIWNIFFSLSTRQPPKRWTSSTRLCPALRLSSSACLHTLSRREPIPAKLGQCPRRGLDREDDSSIRIGRKELHCLSQRTRLGVCPDVIC